MKFWTIVALLVAVCAVFLGVGRTEETAALDNFVEQPFEDVYSDNENDGQLEDSFMNPENVYDDETENALNSVNEIPSNDEDKPAVFKRTPWRRFRFRFVRRRFRFVRRVIRNRCRWIHYHRGWKRICFRFGDEEAPRLTNDEAFIPAKKADDVQEEN